jgi:O-antigen ligase
MIRLDGQQVKKHNIQDWLLAGYVILLPIQFRIMPGFRLALSDLLLALSLLGFALGVGSLKIKRSAWSIWHFGLLIAFLLATLISLVTTSQISRYVLANKDAGLILLYATYAVIVSHAYSWLRIKWICKLLIFSVTTQNILFVVLFIAAKIHGIHIPGLEVGDVRLTGLLIDPNAYGGLLVLTLSIQLRTCCSKEPIVPGAYGWISIATLAVGILLTYSRSAWIGLAVLLVTVTIYKPRIGLLLIITNIAVVLILLRILTPGYLDEMQALAFRESAGERLVLIHDAIPMFWQSPAFGIGLGTFESREGVIIHNTPVWILTEFGLFGFTWFAGFAGWFLYKGLRTYKMAAKQKPLIFSLIIADMVMLGLSMGIEALYQRHWWLVLALIASSYSLAQKERKGYTEIKEARVPAWGR